MPARRILSLWFPALAAERFMRRLGIAPETPFAVIRDTRQMQALASLSPGALAAGLSPGQPLRDAQAVCPALQTRPAHPPAEAAFLTSLRRWATRYSPWVSEDGPDGLLLDITGCAHLFGGEEALMRDAVAQAATLGLTALPGLADTRGCAWALARFAARPPEAARSGDAIDQEARATRSRAVKRRHWTRGGAAPPATDGAAPRARIAPPGHSYSALAPLPPAALRLSPETAEALARLGLRRIGDILGQPRAGLARRFGKELVLRLDQALGSTPEPLSPARPDTRFATRLTLPEPIGLEADMLAALDRLLPRLCTLLEAKGQLARMVRLEAFLAEGGTPQAISVTLARPGTDPARLRPLLAMKLGNIEAGFGIDMLRLEATRTEPLAARQPGNGRHREPPRRDQAGQTALDDLLSRLGARIGTEALTRYHPGESHIPEKSALQMGAIWSPPHPGAWPTAPGRPLLLWRPEPVFAPEAPSPPHHARWRGQDHILTTVSGPERIAPEWWFDDADWQSGTRDYWEMTSDRGDRLWLFFAHGAALSPGWFCHGAFA